MIKPSDKVLIGWLTLLATFASANLGRASANEMSTSTEQSASDNVVDLVVTAQLDVAESANAAVEANAQGILPDNDLQQPEFSSQSVPNEPQLEVTEPESDSDSEIVVAPAPLKPAADPAADFLTNDSDTARLDHLVSTATRQLPDPAPESQSKTAVPEFEAEIVAVPAPSDAAANLSINSGAAAKLDHLVSTVTQPLSEAEVVDQSDVRVTKLKQLVATATRELPTTSSLAHVTADALPSTRVIAPSMPVAEPVVEPNASMDTGNSMETTQVSRDAFTTAATAPLPAGAVPISVVYAPSLHAHNTSVVAEDPASSVKQEEDAPSLAQIPVPDSSGSVGDSFSPEDLTDEELRQLLSVDAPFFPPPVPAPASSFGTPTAYGADEGDAFIGIAGVSDGDRSDTDGSLSLGAGVGDAISSVGVEINVGIISLDGFGDDGQIGFKLHKIIPEADNLAVALGWSNPITWGNADDAEDTIYGVVTQRFDLQPNKSNPLPLIVSAGLGTGSFRSKGAIAAGDNPPNFFGSVGVRVIPEMSLVSSWTGSALNVGVSAAPFEFPLVLSAGASDVTDNTREGIRFSASLGYGFKF